MLRFGQRAAIALTTLLMGASLVVPSLQANPVQAQEVVEVAQKPRGRGRERLLEQIKLTEAQKQKIAAIRQKYRPQMQQHGQKVKTARKELHQMMAGTATKQQLTRKHQEILRLRQQIGDLRFKSMLEIRDVLTPQQRQELARLMEQRRQQRRQRWQQRRQQP
jgi:protein CpxP